MGRLLRELQTGPSIGQRVWRANASIPYEIVLADTKNRSQDRAGVIIANIFNRGNWFGRPDSQENG